jgi:hypothetical protein
MNEYLMQVMVKQQIYDAIREAAVARIAERERQAKPQPVGRMTRARPLLRRAARAFGAYPAGAPASWRDTSRA